jgi:hypothetical protein
MYSNIIKIAETKEASTAHTLGIKSALNRNLVITLTAQ